MLGDLGVVGAGEVAVPLAGGAVGVHGAVDQLALRAQRVEEAVRATGCAEIPSNEVGLAILGPLRELDEVAYLRFASVYRAFTSIEDFAAEIRALRTQPDDLPEHRHHDTDSEDAPHEDVPRDMQPAR